MLKTNIRKITELKALARVVAWLGRVCRKYLTINRSKRSLITWTLICAAICGAVYFQYANYRQRQYSLQAVPAKLLVKSPVSAGKIKNTATAYTYNQHQDEGTGPKRSLTVAADGKQSGNEFYQAGISKKAAGGITFGDTEGNLQFKMVPRFALSAGKLDNGRVIYPQGTTSQQVYTYMRNGLKEDIFLRSAPGKTATYSWDLQMGNKLEARLLPDGSVGIYSADPTLYGNLQISDAKSQKLVDKARTSGKKTSLAFVIPKPYIKDVGGNKNFKDVSYSLDKSAKILTLTASNLDKQQYPLSIDPSVVVTSSSDFQTGFDDGMIDYSTSGQINRSNVSLGTLGVWSATASIATTRAQQSAVAYNGYVYVIGGYDGTTRLNDVQKAAINTTDGTLGTFSATTSFTTAREGHTSVAYNGYMYIIGGFNGAKLSDVQKAAIDPSTGDIGTWTATTSLPAIRTEHASVAYNGYLYVIGGVDVSGRQNDVQKAAINADGTLGSWSATTSFTTARSEHTAVAYNGYMYIVGGVDTSVNPLSDVQKAAINSDGTLGSWSATTSLSTTRYSHGAFAYEGYLYVVGGQSNSSTNLNDVQKVVINADGTLGSWSATTSFTTVRNALSSVVYNGYAYMIAGIGASRMNDVQVAQITTGAPTFGTVGTQGPGTVATNATTTLTGTGTTFTTTFAVGDSITVSGQTSSRVITAIGSNTSLTVSTAFTGTTSGKTYTYFGKTTSFSTPRRNHQSLAYNGYIYVLGGTSVVSISVWYNDVQYAPINSDGSIGTWSTTTSFTGAREGLEAVEFNGYMYVLGGSNVNSSFNDVQYAQINSNGTVGSWVATTSLPAARNSFGATVFNGYLYIAGGYDGTSGATYYNDVQYAKFNSDGTIGSWVATTSLSSARAGQVSVAYNNYLYVIGGTTSAGFITTVQYAPINSDGTIGSWVATTSLPAKRVNFSGVSYDGYVYVMGGYDVNSVYLSSVIKASFNGNGTLGSWTTTTSFNIGRYSQTSTAYNGYIYVLGGDSTSSFLNDVQYTEIQSPAQQAHYERTVDFGSVAQSVDSLTFNGSAVCGAIMSYKTAGSNGIFGSLTTLPSVLPGATYTISAANQRYVWVQIVLNDQNCGTNSNVTDITVNYTLAPPAAPTLNLPANSATNQVLTPQFQMRSTDPENDYLRYKIEVCSTSNCSSIVRTIDQTASQTGWSGQDQQTSTAYTGNSVITSSTMAVHTYQSPPLSAGTQYWWRAYAIDPGGSNSFSSASAINTFTTSATPAAPTLTAPSSGATSVSTTPLFQFRTTDANNDYLRYKIEVCSVSDCSSIVRTIDQTASQTGWSGQNQQANTAYTGNSVITSSTMANHTYQAAALSTGTQYWWRAYGIDPGGSNTFSPASAIQSFTTLIPQTAPAAPTLAYPVSGDTGVPTLPEFRMSTTDAQGDYVKYKIEVCSTSNCSSVVRTIDQTASQTGWRGQDASSGTAYVAGSLIGNSTLADHLYQAAALTANTQYWWRAYAIDPAGSNTFSSASSISTFTTTSNTSGNDILGGTTIKGGTRINN